MSPLFRRPRPDEGPGLLLYAHETDKVPDGYTVENHQYIAHFTDGSWFNSTTGEFCNATGTGVLYCPGPHWTQEQ